MYQSSEAPAAGSEQCKQIRNIIEWPVEGLTEVGRVDGIKDRAVDPEECITGLYGQVPDLLVVGRVGVVVVAVRPEPELRIGVEGVGEYRDGVQGGHEVPDVGHLWLAEGLWSTEGLVAGVVTHAGLGPVEVPVPVGVDSVALALW